jgi:hypothetical protein
VQQANLDAAAGLARCSPRSAAAIEWLVFRREHGNGGTGVSQDAPDFWNPE